MKFQVLLFPFIGFAIFFISRSSFAKPSVYTEKFPFKYEFSNGNLYRSGCSHEVEPHDDCDQVPQFSSLNFLISTLGDPKALKRLN
jgi:hypothetical protein